MYKRIVEIKARRAFAQLNRRQPEKVVKQFADRFSYRFVGDHALGGTRTTRPGMVRWFERVFTVFPGTRFTVHDVLVRGWPWRTRAAVFATLAPPSTASPTPTISSSGSTCAGAGSPTSPPWRTTSAAPTRSGGPQPAGSPRRRRRPSSMAPTAPGQAGGHRDPSS